MKLNNKGFVIEGAVLAIIGVMALFILPQNPLSSALGIGVRPNKTVETQKVEFLKKDLIGRPIAEEDGSYLTKTTATSKEIQQNVGFFEWVRANIILVVLGLIIVVLMGGAGKLWAMWLGAKKVSKQIVVGVDNFFKKNTDPVAQKNLLTELGNSQDMSTKKAVDKIQGK